jgi:polar amino acid transport system substrate-binding protein
MNRLHAAGVALLFSTVLSAPVHADEVRVLFGLTVPPYVIKESNSGYELDIIREALAVKGHTLKPVYASFLAAGKMLKEKSAEGAQRGNPDLTEADGFFYAAEPTVLYEDYAISLKKNKLKIDTIADLKGKSIVAYQGATKYIGPEFAAAVKDANYQEQFSSRRVVQMLYAGGVQVAVFDINIFKYFADLEKKEMDTSAELDLHKIFPTGTLKTNHAVFLDKQLRDDFNAGLAQLKKNGRYKQIIAGYMH